MASAVHASASVISCILWANEDDKSDALTLKTFDITDNKAVHIEDKDEVI